MKVVTDESRDNDWQEMANLEGLAGSNVQIGDWNWTLNDYYY